MVLTANHITPIVALVADRTSSSPSTSFVIGLIGLNGIYHFVS